MSRIFKILQIGFSIIGAVFILSLIIGFRLVKMAGLVIDWESMNSATQILMTIATFIAVYVALEPSRRKPVIHFYMKYNTFIDISLSKSKPKIFITNPSNRTLIIHKIAIYANKLDLMRINLLSDEIERPRIETVNDNDFSKVQPIIIVPNQTVKLSLSVMGLEYVFGHHIDEPDETNKDWLLKIEIIDIKGELTKLKTKITFGEYYNNLISTLTDNYNKE